MIFSVLMIAFLLGSQFSASIVKVHYWWNYDFIVSELCVNRDQPVMQCNGKCFLSQKLKQAEDNQKKAHPASSLDKLPTFSVWFMPMKEQAYSTDFSFRFEHPRVISGELDGFPDHLILPPIA